MENEERLKIDNKIELGVDFAKEVFLGTLYGVGSITSAGFGLLFDCKYILPISAVELVASIISTINARKKILELKKEL